MPSSTLCAVSEGLGFFGLGALGERAPSLARDRRVPERGASSLKVQPSGWPRLVQLVQGSGCRSWLSQRIFLREQGPQAVRPPRERTVEELMEM